MALGSLTAWFHSDWRTGVSATVERQPCHSPEYYLALLVVVTATLQTALLFVCLGRRRRASRRPLEDKLKFGSALRRGRMHGGPPSETSQAAIV